jgi:murein DD-endopeptidase MepM/ murein hydrolase activator NlpD
MGAVLRRWPIWLLLAGALLVATAAGATPTTSEPGASASAYGVTISVPGQGVFGTTEAVAPPDTTIAAAPFAYPSDGSIVSVASASATATSTVSGIATGMASAELSGVTLFGGEISIEHLVASAEAGATSGEANSTTYPTEVTGATFMQQPISFSINGRVELADWGYMQTLVESVTGGDPGTVGKHQSLRVLDIHIVADHDGLPAGSEIVIGGVDALAEASPVTETTTIPKSGPSQIPPKQEHKAHQKPEKKKEKKKKTKGNGKPGSSSIVKPVPSNLHPKLSRKGRVFPVYGQSWFSDSFGAPRADTGWHHGIDIFAPMGTPVLAVADGTVFMVGWNDLGGNRLWLRDQDGDEFYYAHLSAYSPLAVDGLHVKAGDVLGFVGNSGDAITTPPHLHFEAHAAMLVPLGYDQSAVDPYQWLVGLQHLKDVAFPAGTASWAMQIAHSVSPQQPGAVLLHATDISALPRLDSWSLESLLGTKSASPRD